MENPIDKEYREYVLEYYMSDATLVGTTEFPKWVASCPFSSDLKKTKSNACGKCAALLWVPTDNSWKFSCQNAGSEKCLYAMAFPSFLSKLNPQLGNQYVLERYPWSAVAMGSNYSPRGRQKRCGQPPKFRSRSRPQNQGPKRPDQSKPEDGQIADRP